MACFFPKKTKKSFGSAHELRNEVVEELNSDLMSQSGANLDSKLVRGNKNSGMENEKGRRGEKSGERGQGDSLGEASLSEARGYRGVARARFKLSPGRARWQSLLGRRTV